MTGQRWRSLYASRPDLYDLMHAEVTDDLQFVQEFAQTLGESPRVLELGCGTGRLMKSLLEAGCQVTGLDLEPAMLAVARTSLSAFEGRFRLVAGDMRTFAVARPFDLAVVGLNTFMHLLSTGDQLDALQRIHAHLRPGGLLLLDLANPHTVFRDVPLGVVQHRFTRAGATAEHTVTLWSVTTAAPADQLAESILFFDETDGAHGTVQRTVAGVMLRLIYRYELALLLARSGFAVRALYGGYDSAPYDDEGDRLLAVAAAYV